MEINDSVWLRLPNGKWCHAMPTDSDMKRRQRLALWLKKQINPKTNQPYRLKDIYK